MVLKKVICIFAQRICGIKIRSKLLYVNIFSHRSFEEHHVDEGDEKIWSTVLTERSFKVRPVHQPLHEDHEDEVAEDEDEEYDLGEELQDDGVVLPVVDFVPHAEEDPKGHVDHPEDQGDLHLVSIQKRYRV